MLLYPNGYKAFVLETLIAAKEDIFEVNRKDMAAAVENGIAASVKKRLKFDVGKPETPLTTGRAAVFSSV